MDTSSRASGPQPPSPNLSTTQSSLSHGSSLTSHDLEKSAVSQPQASSRFAALNPKTWTRKQRIFALVGLVILSMALIPAIVVPVVTQQAKHKVANDTALRIMPLGASITYGFLSTDGNGYREDLLDLLERGGNTQISYVGSRNNGTMDENAVEGWPGYRIDQVMAKAAAAVPRYLPNVILLNVGTNDCVQNWNMDNTTQKSTVEPSLTTNSTFDVGDRMRILVNDLLEWSPNTTVIMSTLILNKQDAVNTRVNDANAQFRDVAAALKADGKRVVLADMTTAAGGPNITTMADVTHPNDVGYALMANRWYVALQEAGQQGLLMAPDPTS
ncbi:SGNH hydrolase-type esterase domain-containing protein [Coniella lustricola]|uniref:SGNH hydrolase-type esterase domain-containing protein n=1 Tax=Coniella lustricola TaxID=2025994 RepID=A0A2T3A213_9PEZI|nr:SGNH hydrolase-type esterase domain-containing protein [Coniella lustricola]